jgi:hypothetical protein
MTYFAKVENNIVVQIATVEKEFLESNPERYIGTWIQTSYNTKGGIHYNPETGQPSDDQSKSLRKNYAGIGYVYDEQRDAFYAPQPFPSWTLNEDSCIWESPVPYPIDDKIYEWNETTQEWVEVIFAI